MPIGESENAIKVIEALKNELPHSKQMDTQTLRNIKMLSDHDKKAVGKRAPPRVAKILNENLNFFRLN